MCCRLRVGVREHLAGLSCLLPCDVPGLRLRLSTSVADVFTTSSFCPPPQELSYVLFFKIFSFHLCFETGPHHGALADLELMLKARLASNL